MTSSTDHLHDTLRRSNKPLLEKKRRARINTSLDELKTLVLDALKKDTARYSKLEKADILEMTVKHLRDVQRRQLAVAMSVDPTVLNKFRSGYSECAQEVSRYLSTIDGLNSETRNRLIQHLSCCSTSPEHVISPYVRVAAPPVGYPVATPLGALPGYPAGVPPIESFQRNSMHQFVYPQSYPRENWSPSSSELDSSFECSASLCSSPGGAASSSPGGVTVQQQSLEAKPLGERNINLNCRVPQQHDHRAFKTERPVKVEATKQFSVAEQDDVVRNAVHVNQRPVDFALHVKQEPVWRPW